MQIRELAPGERERVHKYLLLDEEQLISLIPAYLTEYDGWRFSPEGQREAGKSWFEAIRGSLEEKVCTELEMCKKLSDPEITDVTTLVVIIGDAVATQTTVVPPVLIATIIVRMGVRRFCKCP